MKCKLILLLTMMLFLFTSCAEKNENKEEQPVHTTVIEVLEPEIAEKNTCAKVRVDGPYGSIQLEVPDAWEAMALTVGDERLMNADYGIQFYPKNDKTKCIEVGYHTGFGVCGTGLEEKETTIAGAQAKIGYYDGNENWNFIVFEEQLKHIVVINGQKIMTEEEKKEAFAILDTLVYDPNDQSGAIGVHNFDELNDQLGIEVMIHKVDRTSAEVTIYYFDSTAQEVITYGEAFIIEKKENEHWEKLKGDFAFNSVSYPIKPGEKAIKDIGWGDMYGKLEAGDYRVKIPISTTRQDQTVSHELYAYFLIR